MPEPCSFPWLLWGLLAAAWMPVGAGAADPAILYRVSATSETAISFFSTTLVWSNHPAGGAYRIEATTDLLDVPWQPVDTGTFAGTMGGRLVRRPVSPVPTDAGIVGVTAMAMGDSSGDGPASETPVHMVAVDAGFIDRYEVTAAQMAEMMQWAYDEGLISVTTTGVFNLEGDARRLLALDDPGGLVSFANDVFAVRPGFEQRPITHVTWYGAMAYARFRGERDGLASGIDFTNWTCNTAEPGYRLPTEAEWEKAARGEVAGQRFPWGGDSTNLFDDIDGSRANYWGSGDVFESTNDLYLADIGSFDDRNPVGLHDLAGNVYEWCLDWYDYGWYTNAAATAADTTGPATGVTRVVRGGAWCDTPDLLRAAHRSAAPPQAALPFVGFRCFRPF